MKKKLLLTFGSVAAIVTPIATVVACGVDTKVNSETTPFVGAEQSKATVVGKKHNFVTTIGGANHGSVLQFLHSHIAKESESGWIPTSNVDNKLQNNIIYVRGVEYRLSKVGNKDTNDSIYIGKDDKLVMVVLTSVADTTEKLFVSAASAQVKEFYDHTNREVKALDYDWNNPTEFVPYATDDRLYLMDMLSDVKDEKGVHHQDPHRTYVNSFGTKDELLSNSSNDFKGTFQDVKHEAEFLSAWNKITESEFVGSPNITSLSFVELDVIKKNAFKDSKITSLYMKKVYEVGDNAFMSIVNDSATEVDIPNAFNSDEEKDRIFGKDNWGNIQFTFHGEK